MSNNLVSSIIILLVLASSLMGQTYTSVAYKYANVRFPGAMLTIANGINNGDVIVGSFFDSNSSVHGFVYRKGKYVQVDYPGSTETEILGINDNGALVGTYQVPGPLNFHGFLWQDGNFTNIDEPQAQFGTKVFGINKAGTMVGSLDDTHGFILKDDSFTIFDAPSPSGTQASTQLNGISNLGWVSGQVLSGGSWRGFWFKGGDLDFLEKQGASDNQVTGMNGRGDIVGCHDAMSGFVSFRVETGEAHENGEAFPRQQNLASCPSGINYARVVVGNYFRINQPAAFIAVPQLTLNVAGPRDHSVVSTPVSFSAAASGLSSIQEIQVWVNSVKVRFVRGAIFNTKVALPIGANERVVLQAIDSKGTKTKVVLTLTVQ